jgi:hypothetical protein
MEYACYSFTHAFEKIFNVEQTLHNIKYLCYKTFMDSETNELLETSNVSKLVVS